MPASSIVPAVWTVQTEEIAACGRLLDAATLVKRFR
jgi:hypothetical protein